MKKTVYSRLAWTGIRKNKQLYTPYILTCIGMIMMFYIISALSKSTLLNEMKGGGNIQALLSLGIGVIGVFALVFLFYTNSFLIRRRQKEFGLYNILGMDKKNIGRIIIWESFLISLISLVAGLLSGIILSKLAELLLFNIINTDVNFALSIDLNAIWSSVLVFMIIFTLILLNTYRKVRLSKPISLLNSENLGEKPPKANWIITVFGVLILSVAYYIAVTIKDPLMALGQFFIAIILVIIATYLLFISGSVTFCRILQKRKSYYKPNRFVSISSMVYRMKRNGAGLASICILGTMVLVILATTISLYVGSEDSLRKRFPRDIKISVSVNQLEYLKDDRISVYRDAINKAVSSQSVQSISEYRAASIGGSFKNGNILIDLNNSSSLFDYDSLFQVYIISLEDYNKYSGTNKTLNPNEAFVYSAKKIHFSSIITIGNAKELQVKEVLPSFFNGIMDNLQIIPSMCVVVSDFDDFVKPLMTLRSEHDYPMLRLEWSYGFNLDAPDGVHSNILRNFINNFKDIYNENEEVFSSYYGESIVEQRADFFMTYGGLLFLGILLSIVFVFAAVLIIYYKQISEGHEDHSRFDIMQKIGMTKKEIQKSINSQILTVFMLPLIFAGLHLSFAFPILWKLLQLFSLYDMVLLIIVTIICFLIFGVFYALVYKITASAYYKIVSGAKES